MCRSAWLRGARAEPWGGVAAGRWRWGASGGTLPGRSRKNAVFFLSALRTIIFPLPSLSRRGREA